jgi:putative effector of murein hydrolase LrgA (UPF0299 family)
VSIGPGAQASDEVTPSTRLAANAGAVAEVAYAALFFVSTQVKIVRAASPFGDDPWDVVVSYGAIFLTIVVGATAVRSLRHRESRLEPAIAARIRTGVGMGLVTIGLTLASDISALLFAPLPEPEAAADGRLALIVALIVISGVTAIVATALLIRAVAIALRTASLPTDVASEPDILDDLLGLARDGSRWLPPIRTGMDRLTSVLDRFLATSPASPRRHRVAFGVVGAVAAGLAFDVWHAIVEGPWGSLFALGLFAVLTAAGVFAVYIATIGPLRLIRPAD